MSELVEDLILVKFWNFAINLVPKNTRVDNLSNFRTKISPHCSGTHAWVNRISGEFCPEADSVAAWGPLLKNEIRTKGKFNNRNSRRPWCANKDQLSEILLPKITSDTHHYSKNLIIQIYEVNGQSNTVSRQSWQKNIFLKIENLNQLTLVFLNISLSYKKSEFFKI